MQIFGQKSANFLHFAKCTLQNRGILGIFGQNPVFLRHFMLIYTFSAVYTAKIAPFSANFHCIRSQLPCKTSQLRRFYAVMYPK